MITRRSLVLILLASAIVFGYTYCLDILQALEVHLREAPYQFSTLEFNLMYFFTYLPIFLFNIPIGTIIDRNEVTTSILFLLIISLASQMISTIMICSRPTGYIIVMYLMRSLFGLAGQGIFTVQSLIITRYVKDNYQIVMSVALSLPFVLDSINSIVTTRVYDSTHNMAYPWIIGNAVCLVALVAGLAVIVKYVLPAKQSSISKRQSLLGQSNQELDLSTQQDETFNLKQLKSFNSTFWFLILAIFFSQFCLGSFNDNMNDLLVKRFNISYTDAGTLLIVPFACLTIFSIIFSIVLTIKPKIRRPIYVISSSSYLLGTLALYLLPQTNNPTPIYYAIITFFSLTFSFSFSIFYTAILAAIPYVVDKQTVGTAFGVIGCVVGLSQCIGPFMNIAIINSDDDLSKSYKSLNLAFVFLASISVFLACWINFKDFSVLDSKMEDADEKEIKDNQNQKNQNE